VIDGYSNGLHPRLIMGVECQLKPSSCVANSSLGSSFTRPGKHTKNYGTSPFFNIFHGKIHELNGDSPVRYVKLPEGSLLAQVDIQTLH
jgi:hypothetical protein